MKASLFIVFLVISVFFFECEGFDRVPACDEVCGRSQPEQDACCRAHGYAAGTCSSFTKILCRRELNVPG
uniref:Diapause-specific peptide n=1 Tax=Panagrolaimus sp. ES5 TaxID=591445 RepID=A0AC34FP15_9BILA